MQPPLKEVYPPPPWHASPSEKENRTDQERKHRIKNHPPGGRKKHCAPTLPPQGKHSNGRKHTPSSNPLQQAETEEAQKKRKDSKRKPPKRQERNNINREETQISLPKSASLFLFPRRPFFPTHPLPYVLPRTAPIPCVLSSFYVQYRKYKPIIQAAGSSMKLEKSGQRAKMDISIKSI